MKAIFLLFIPLFSLAQARVERFGATGDGTTNDAAALQAALNSGSETVYFEAGKTYITNRPLIIPSHTTIVGNGAVLKPDITFPASRVGVIMTLKRTTFKDDDVSINVTKDDPTFTYSNTKKLKVGQLVELDGDVYAAFGNNEATYKNGWYGLVKSISDGTVTLTLPADATFTARSIKMYATTTDVHITGLSIDLQGRESGYGIGLINAVNASVEGCSIRSDSSETKSAEMGIYAQGMDLKILNNTIEKIRIARNGAGYGINVEGHTVLIQGNKIFSARHCITSAGRQFFSSDINIRGNTVTSGGGYAPIDFHGNASGVIDSNYIYSTMPNIYGIAIRNNNTTIKDNYIEMQGEKVTAVKAFEMAGENINVTGNKIKFHGKGKAFGAANVMKNLKVENNQSEKDN
jgi:hypothetical protein